MSRLDDVDLTLRLSSKGEARQLDVAQKRLLQLRQQMVNVALAGKPDDEMKPVVEAYTAAAAQMAGIEARAFAKIYATLKPDQQSRAGQAFALMAGIFQPAAPRGPGGRGQRSGGAL